MDKNDEHMRRGNKNTNRKVSHTFYAFLSKSLSIGKTHTSLSLTYFVSLFLHLSSPIFLSFFFTLSLFLDLSLSLLYLSVFISLSSFLSDIFSLPFFLSHIPTQTECKVVQYFFLFFLFFFLSADICIRSV